MHHILGVPRAVISPDSRFAATCSYDGTAAVWDIDSGELASTVLHHGSSINSIHFLPDGRRLLTASHDGTARLWDALTGEPVSPPLRHASVVEHVVFSPDGTSLLTSSQDMTASVWEVPPGLLPIADVELFARLLSNRRFDSTGGMTRVSQAELRHAWETLRRKYPEAFQVTAEEAERLIEEAAP